MENTVRVGWELRQMLNTFSNTEIAIAVSFGASLEDVYKPYLASATALQEVMKAAAATVLTSRHGLSDTVWSGVLEGLSGLGAALWTEASMPPRPKPPAKPKRRPPTQVVPPIFAPLLERLEGFRLPNESKNLFAARMAQENNLSHVMVKRWVYKIDLPQTVSSVYYQKLDSLLSKTTEKGDNPKALPPLKNKGDNDSREIEILNTFKQNPTTKLNLAMLREALPKYSNMQLLVTLGVLKHKNALNSQGRRWFLPNPITTSAALST